MHAQAQPERCGIAASSGADTGTSSSSAACNLMSPPHQCKPTLRHSGSTTSKGRAFGLARRSSGTAAVGAEQNTRIAETEFAAGNFFELQA